MYAYGILGDGERKSVEPIAARASGDAALVRAYTERLLHFVGDAKWDDQAVRRIAAEHAIEAMSEQEAVTVWIIDDTGMLKQGTHSVGVQRQYTGSAGKIANCQIAVTLSAATRHEAMPIDVALYLPELWTSDVELRRKARIPDNVTFKTKPDLALDMIERACLDNVPGEIVLADSAYGDSTEFRNGVRLYGLDYAVGVRALTKVFVANAAGRLRGHAVSVSDLAKTVGRKAFRRVTWRDGTSSKKLSARFCFRRVKVAHDDGTPLDDRDEVWVVMEWRDGEPEPARYHLTTLPRRMTKKEIVRIIKERWRTERVYQELKGELGFDHFEGRSFPGWHHHVSVVLCCYAFVVAERLRHFPPRRSPPKTVRSNARPERHFEDSFASIRLAIARFLATWLPRCPLCHRANILHAHVRPK
jgi:SRSO17 transposase